MAASRHTQSLRDEVTCSICLEYFTDPVCIECGHNFCRACINRCWAVGGPGRTRPLCPQCRAVCTGRALHPNVGLRNIAEVIRVSSSAPAPTPEAGGLCPRHQQRLQLFCETDLAPICVVCDRSQEHRWHNVIPVEEAGPEYKVTLNNRVKQLNKELVDLQMRVAEESGTASDLERNYNIQTVKIINMFEHLKRFLEKEKEQLLTRLEKEHQVYMKIIQEKVSELEKQQLAHRGLITEIEGICQKQDVELLKDVQSILNRCDHLKTVKPEEGVKLLPTVRKIEHQYIQDKLAELEKALPAELNTFITGFQTQTIAFECVVQKLDELYCRLKEMSSPNTTKRRKVVKRIAATSEF